MSNKQFGFVLLLGIITSVLVYEIINKQMRIEGFNPFGFITKPINAIINGIKDIIEFLCFIKKWFAWLANTIICIMSYLNPLCWIPYLIDAVMAFAYVIALYILKPLGLKIVLDWVSNGKKGLNETFHATNGVRPFQYPEFITKMCYWCKIKPMPQYKTNIKAPVVTNPDEE
jgi:hypothetical protein